jgi:hypothetical protein
MGIQLIRMIGRAITSLQACSSSTTGGNKQAASSLPSSCTERALIGAGGKGPAISLPLAFKSMTYGKGVVSYSAKNQVEACGNDTGSYNAALAQESGIL